MANRFCVTARNFKQLQKIVMKANNMFLIICCVALLCSCRTVHLVKTSEKEKTDSTAIQHVDSVRLSNTATNYIKTDSSAVKSTLSENKGIDFSVEFFAPDSVAKTDSTPVNIGFVNNQLTVDAGHAKIKSISFKNVSASQRDLLINNMLKIDSSTKHTDSINVTADNNTTVKSEKAKESKDKSFSGLQIFGFTVFVLLLAGVFVLAGLMYKKKILMPGKENDLIG